MPAQQRRLAAGVGADDHRDPVVGDAHGQVGRRPRARRTRARRGRRPAARAPSLDGRRVATACRPERSCHALLPVRPRTSSQSRNGAPNAPVTTPTGKLTSAHAGSRRRSRRRRPRSRPTSAAPSSVVRPPLRARAIGPARNATNAIGPAAATPTAVEHDGEQQQRVGTPRGVTPRPAAVSSPSSVIRSDRASQTISGSSTSRNSGQQPDRRPVGAAARCRSASAASAGRRTRRRG